MKLRNLIPRFGMRTLIVVLTLVAFWMGAIGRHIAAVNAERRCIVEMEASGAHFLMQRTFGTNSTTNRHRFIRLV